MRKEREGEEKRGEEETRRGNKKGEEQGEKKRGEERK